MCLSFSITTVAYSFEQQYQVRKHYAPSGCGPRRKEEGHDCSPKRVGWNTDGSPLTDCLMAPSCNQLQAANNEPFPNDKTSFSTTTPVHAPFLCFLSISLSFSDSPIAGRNDNKFVCDCVISLAFPTNFIKIIFDGLPIYPSFIRSA